MKVITTTEHLQNAVGSAERFTTRHVTLPILSHLLFSVRDHKFIVSATNLEMGVECVITGKIIKPGQATAPARIITQLLHSISEDTITLEAEREHLTLSTAASTVTLFGVSPKDFPPALPTIQRETSFTLPHEAFAAAFTRALPAAATTDLKPELAGIFLVVEPERFIVTATDAFRLVEVVSPAATGIAERVECIVPARAIQEVLRILPPSGDITMVLGEHQVLFEWPEVRILSRLVDGSYPPYENLFPKDYETTLLIERDDLVKKIRLAAVFSSRLNEVTLTYTPRELEVSTANSESGQTRAHLAAKGRGAAGSAMFNHRFLLDGLEAAGGEQVTLNLSSAAGPALVQNPDDPTFRCLLMPIRTT